MNDVEFQTKNLVAAIKKSNVFHQYHRLQKKIASESELYTLFNEFRRKNFLMQIQGSEPQLKDSNALMAEYSEVVNNPTVSEFLVSEQRLCKIIREVNIKLLENLDMDMEHLK